VVHILVNNSGGPPAGALHASATEAFDAPWKQQLLAAHELMRAVLPGMKAAGYGRIINVISTSVKAPLRGLGVSNTIRAAVANWSKTLSMELAPWGITVNNVLPGATLTQRLVSIIEGKAASTGHSVEDIQKDMLAEIPAGRFGTPEEVAAAVAFLASPAAGYINGIHLPVDGGRTPNL
jgi:3-oxoacyl-[acyl-carrier protein] reductase